MNVSAPVSQLITDGENDIDNENMFADNDIENSVERAQLKAEKKQANFSLTSKKIRHISGSAAAASIKPSKLSNQTDQTTSQPSLPSAETASTSKPVFLPLFILVFKCIKSSAKFNNKKKIVRNGK